MILWGLKFPSSIRLLIVKYTFEVHVFPIAVILTLELFVLFVPDMFARIHASSKSLCALHCSRSSLSTSVWEDGFPSQPPCPGAVNSCHKVWSISETRGGTELLPISPLSVSVVSLVSHTLRLFTGPGRGDNRSVSCYTSH